MKMYVAKYSNPGKCNESINNSYVLFVIGSISLVVIGCSKIKEELLIKLDLLFPDMHLAPLSEQKIYEMTKDIPCSNGKRYIKDVYEVENVEIPDDINTADCKKIFGIEYPIFIA